ncbi:hypothetical protein CTI12_AA239990 [Artemisia annua]|uniref:RRM domain-containing protein n=1 Tax=Artemisia annua TaxID=35608 RepID=A0A2U1MW93_ARTAN|nr:hypothetical protein CTI12_AA239990 [Artemisia annua]
MVLMDRPPISVRVILYQVFESLWQLSKLRCNDELRMKIRYREIVDVNLVRDKGTGKSIGFAFVAYEDQRSTVLAVGQSLDPSDFIFT